MARRPSRVSEPAMAIYHKAKISPNDVLGLEEDSLSEPLLRVEAFRGGLSKESFDRLKEISGLDNNILASALAISSKTLQRKEIFDTVQSEKMYELAELYALGTNYFGRDGFKRWMERPLFSLGNRIPLDLIDVSEGMDILKAEIMRMQHGIAI